jgi:hypothetical protein
VKRLPEYLLVLYSLCGTISISASHAVMAAGALVAAVDRGRRIRWRRTGLEWPVLAWIAAALLATVFATAPAESFAKMRKILIFAIAWWAPAVVHRRWGLGRLYMGLLFGAGTTSLYGVLTFFLHGGPELSVRIDGFHGFYLTNSGMLLLCAFPALLLAACRTIAPSHRIGAGIAAASILAVLLLGQLPGAWLGNAAGFLYLALRSGRPWRALAVPAVFLVLAVVPSIVQDGARKLLDPASPANLERARVWENGWRLFALDPFTGQGLQDLRTDYERVRGPLDATRGHMESVPVQIAASAGIPGLLAFGWLMVAIFRRLSRARREAGDDGFLRALVDGTVAGVVAFLGAGLLEWNFGDSEILALLFFLIGTALAAGSVGAAGAARTAAS